MFATLNFQLTSAVKTLEPAAELTGAITASQPGKEGGHSPFSQLLGQRTDLAFDAEATGGEFLPQSGKPLPPLRPSPLVNGQPGSPQLLDDVEGLSSLEIPVTVPDSTEPKPAGTRNRDPDLDLAIDVAYQPSEIALVEPSHVTLLPIEKIPGVQMGPTPIKPVEIRPEPTTRLGSDALTVMRPIQALTPELSNALAAQTQNLVAPAAGDATILPNAEGLVRDRLMQATQQAPVTAAVVGDGSIENTQDKLLAPLAGTAGAVTSVQKPDFRVSGPSSVQNSAPAHLTPMVSPFASETGLLRGEPLLETISTPVRDAAWGQKLGEQLITLTGNQIRTAEIKLTPADLGPLRVQISVEEGAANVTFQAQHAVTREAIEQALPRLREMMAESGLSLGQTDVSEQGVSDGNQEQELESTASGDERMDETAEAGHLERRKTVASNNLLDTFA